MNKRSAPLVGYDELKVKEYPAPIRVGSETWFDWLEQNRSFHYECDKGKFTACKESRASGNFWYANRRVAGKLRRCYIGASKDLKLEKLLEIAKQLAGSDLSYWGKKSHTLNPCVTERTQTEGAALEELKKQVSELQKKLDHERMINAGLRTEIDHALTSLKAFETSRVAEVNLSKVKVYKLHKKSVVRLKDLEVAGYQVITEDSFGL
jgi:hypothetical protein